MVILFTLNTTDPSTREIKAGLSPMMEASIFQGGNLQSGPLGIF